MLKFPKQSQIEMSYPWGCWVSFLNPTYVDLLFNSTFNKPKVMESAFPAKPDPNQPVDKTEVNGITFLLSEKDKVFMYPGALKPETELSKTDFSPNGIRKILRQSNAAVISKIKALNEEANKTNMPDSTYKKKSIEIKGDKKALVVLVKADDKASYKNVIDMVDELNIASVGKFAIMEMTEDEKSKLLTAK